MDKYIANLKKIFLKSPSRVRIFKEIAPTVPLPPKPVLTRWGTWLDAACYYAQYYNDVIKVLNALTGEDSSSITTAKTLASEQLLQDLLFIVHNFKDLSPAISRLESRNLELSESLGVIDDLYITKIQPTDGPALVVKHKLQNVLKKNNGYSYLCKIRNELTATEKTQSDNKIENAGENDIKYFKFAPVTSCDVERSFSQFKSCFTEHRRSFTFENLRMYIVIHCNKVYESQT